MAKQNPLFINAEGHLEKIDGVNDSIDESVIQLATNSINGLFSSSDKVKLNELQSSYIELIAGEDVGTGDYVYVDDAKKVFLADYSDPDKRAIAFVIEGGSTNDLVKISTDKYTLNEYIELGVYGVPVYLINSGQVTVDISVVLTNGTYVQKLGTSIGFYKILNDIESNIIILG